MSLLPQNGCCCFLVFFLPIPKVLSNRRWKLSICWHSNTMVFWSKVELAEFKQDIYVIPPLSRNTFAVLVVIVNIWGFL